MGLAPRFHGLLLAREPAVFGLSIRLTFLNGESGNPHMDSQSRTRTALGRCNSGPLAGLDEAKPLVVVAVGCGPVVTVGGAQPVRVVVPRAAAQHTGIA